MTTETDFLAFAAGVLGVQPPTLNLSTSYNSLPEWDSVNHLRLVMEFEAKYGRSLSIDQIPQMTTLDAFYSLIK